MSLAPILLQSLKVNLAGWRPGSATRCALVLGLVLISGSLLGHPSWGVAAAIGAFNAGLASLSGVYRTRLRTMFQVCLVSFGCALLGGLVGTSLPLAVLTLTLGCLLFTVYGEVVPAAATLTLQAIMTLLILSGLRLPPSAVPGTALLVLLGGAAQVLVLGALWPLGKYQPERRAVSLVFAALADFVQGWEPAQKGRATLQTVGDPAPGSPLPIRLFPDDAPFRDAAAALASVKPGTWRASHGGLRVLLEEAEGLRAALISLGLQPWVRAQDEQARLVRRVLVRALSQLRQSVRQGEGTVAGEAGPPAVSSGALRALRVAAGRAAPRLVVAVSGQPEDEMKDESGPLALALGLLERLSLPVVPADHSPTAQVTRPTDTADSGMTTATWTETPPAPRLWQLRPSPSQWQHSLRLALTVGMSDLLVRLLALPHGYWLPLTVGLVLRADYLTTVTRGAGRLLGTLAAVLVGLLLGLAHPSPQVDTLLVLAAAWLAYALLQVGYAPFSAAVSLYVIFSVSASGLSQGAVAEGRLLYTVLGGVLALGAFLVWPIWQARTARERLRQVALRQQEYAALLLNVGGSEGENRVEAARTAARDARLAAEGAVMAAAAEPRWASRSDPFRDLAQANMARLSANAARLLALHLMVRNSRGRGADPATRRALEASQGVARRAEQDLVEQAG